MSSEPSSRRSRRPSRAASLLAAALAVSLLAAACGSSQPAASSSTPAPGAATGAAKPKALLNTHRIELAIEQSVLSQRDVHVKVICPKAIPERKGRDFHCIATEGRVRTPFAVVQRNDEGYVTYSAE